MARVNVYLPDELAHEWRTAGMNLSGVTQVAVRRELARWSTDRWLLRLAVQRVRDVSHGETLESLREGGAATRVGGDP